MTMTTEFKNDIKEFSIVLSMSITLLIVSLVFVFYIVRNYVDVNSLLASGFEGKKVYLFLPDENEKRVKEIGLEKNYKQNISYIKNVLKDDYKVVEVHNLNNLDKTAPILVIDNFVLSEDEKYQLEEYVAKGGSVVFNFNIDRTFLNKITPLREYDRVKPTQKNPFFLVSNLLSPIQIPNAKRLDMVLYDYIPLFTGKKPLIEITNWAMNDGIYKEDKRLPNGVMWSGNYKKGKWIYFSFPLYVFESENYNYDKLFKSMIDYAYNRYKVIKYPYLDYDKMIFISEDTEYKFENLSNFAKKIQKLDVNATAFCVGKLAKEHKKLMNKIGKNPYIEIASHSYSHTNLLEASDSKLEIEIEKNKLLLEKLSHQKIVGFRPPREETNKKLRYYLKKSGFKYVLEKNINQLKSKLDDNLLIIPRLGTDDYAYLIKLEWDKEKIINNSIKEMQFITNLGAIYTLSTHTHLLSYKTNINILEKIISKFKKFNIGILKGKDIAKRIFQTKNIVIKTSLTESNILVNVINNNKKEIKNFTFRVYGKIKKVSSDYFNIKAVIIKKTDDYADIRIKKLPKFADVILFLGVEK